MPDPRDLRKESLDQIDWAIYKSGGFSYLAWAKQVNLNLGVK
jgi:hypothetical protein